MDHDYISEQGLVALYIANKLAPEERASFEEHFVDCKQCLDEIEVTGDLRDALKQVAKQGDARRSVARPGERSAGTGFAFWQPRPLAYATLVLAIGLAAVFATLARHRSSELAEARRTSDEWQRRYDEERQTRETLQEQVAGRSANTVDQNTLVANLQPAAPLFFLNVTRGSDQDGSAPANLIAVPSTSPSIALSLEFEKDPAFQSYRAQLRDSQGRVLWAAENISPPPSNAIAITVPSRLLSRGNYIVALDGLTSTGRYRAAAHFSFQVNPQK